MTYADPVVDLTPTKSFTLQLLMAANICPLAARPQTAGTEDKRGRVTDHREGLREAETDRKNVFL